MRVSLISLFSLVVAIAGVYAHDESECNCQVQIEAATHEIVAQRDMHHRDVQTLLEQRDQLTRERDELVHGRDTLSRERDELFQAKEELARTSGVLSAETEQKLEEVSTELLSHRSALADAEVAKRSYEQEIEKLKKDVERGLEDRAHFQQVAQENQHYMQEYKVRLATIRDKSAKLDLELEAAYAKIRELEQATLVTKIKKEFAAGYESFLQLIGKHKDGLEEPAQDL